MEYLPITLPDSKEVVLVRPVSPFLLNKLRRAYPPPKPPVQPVNLGTSDNPLWEDSPNESHPDYIEARAAWQLDLEQRIRRFNISLGAKIEWTAEKRALLAEMREQVARAGEGDLIEGDDDFAYISYIACATAEDYKLLLNTIMSTSRPTEEAIQEGIATFQPGPNGDGSDLPGPEHIQHNGTSERNPSLV
jgi:hypothetical protein